MANTFQWFDGMRFGGISITVINTVKDDGIPCYAMKWLEAIKNPQSIARYGF
jgi:hypothetical protein